MLAVFVIKVMADDDTNGLARIGFSNAPFLAGGNPYTGHCLA